MIGQFLSAFPNFGFDLSTYVRATTYSNELMRSLRRSIRFFAGEKSTQLEIPEILEFATAYGDGKIASNWNDVPPPNRDILRRSASDRMRSSSVAGYVKETSGTSGVPLQALYSEYFQFLNSVSIVPWLRAAAQINNSKRRVAALALRNARQRKIVGVEPWSDGRLLVKISLDERRSESFKEVIHLISKLEPEIIISKPTIFEALLWGIGQFSLRTTARPSLLVSSGQLLSHALVSELAATFQAPVLDVYATTELGPAAARCSACGSFHFDESKCFIEVKHGQIFVSMILNSLMPIIRHHMDDITQSGSDCPNGLRCFEPFRIKVGQFVPLSGDIALDVSRLKVGRTLGTTVERVEASVHRGCLTILVIVGDDYFPSQDAVSLLKRSIAQNVPSQFAVEFLVVSKGAGEPILRVLS